MDISPEHLAELRNWVKDLNITKYEVFGLYVFTLITVKLRAIKEFVLELRAINLDAKHRRIALNAKIEREAKRRSKSKGKK